MVGEAPGHRLHGMLLHLDEPVGLAINLPGQMNLLAVRKHKRRGGIQHNIIAHMHVIAQIQADDRGGNPERTVIAHMQGGWFHRHQRGGNSQVNIGSYHGARCDTALNPAGA